MTPNTDTLDTSTEPQPIKAVPLRHPGRWIAATVVVVILALFLWGAATNPAYGWDTYANYLFDKRIVSGAITTLELTVLAMAIAIVLGVVLAVMRLSPNPVLRSVAWVYLWIFRGTPVYVQLVFWGLFPSLYKTIVLGIPWGPQFVSFDIQSLNAPFLLAMIGLGLNEAAYMAEIVRAGISFGRRGPDRGVASRSACRGRRRCAASCCRRRCA